MYVLDIFNKVLLNSLLPSKMIECKKKEIMYLSEKALAENG